MQLQLNASRLSFNVPAHSESPSLWPSMTVNRAVSDLVPYANEMPVLAWDIGRDMVFESTRYAVGLGVDKTDWYKSFI